MKVYFKHWRTTAAGLVCCVIAVYDVYMSKAITEKGLGLLTTGVGLIAAKDIAGGDKK